MMSVESRSVASDAATDVGMDTSVDLIKYRLPYLESELTAGSKDALLTMTSHAQHEMMARMKLGSNRTSPRGSRPSTKNSGTTTQASAAGAPTPPVPFLPQAILDSLSLGVRKQLPQDRGDNKLPTLLSRDNSDFGEKGFKLTGIGLSRSQSVRDSSTPTTRPLARSPITRQAKSLSFNRGYSRGPVPRTPATRPAPRTPASRGSSRHSSRSEFIQLHRSRTELEVMEQAKQLLSGSGLDGAGLLQQDVARLGRGLSTLYLSDYGLSEARVSDTAGMSQHKHVPHNVTDIPHDIETTAERHIYMCQIPSLMTRTSVAGARVRNLRARLNPRASRGTRQLDGRFMDDKLETSRRRPLVLYADRSLHDRSLHASSPGRGNMYRSQDGLFRSTDTLYRSTERLDAFRDPLRIAGSPANIAASKERVM